MAPSAPVLAFELNFTNIRKFARSIILYTIITVADLAILYLGCNKSRISNHCKTGRSNEHIWNYPPPSFGNMCKINQSAAKPARRHGFSSLAPSKKLIVPYWHKSPLFACLSKKHETQIDPCRPRSCGICPEASLLAALRAGSRSTVHYMSECRFSYTGVAQPLIIILNVKNQ